jgi:hypothetical protein
MRGKAMHIRRVSTALVVLVLIQAASLAAASTVPFRGNWSGSTVSAIPQSENVVLVVSSGIGNLAHLGKFEMTSPHLTYLDTFRIEGTQIFTAANGDKIYATIEGQLAPNPDGTLGGAIDGVITGGTGRFVEASGAYTFNITATPAAFGFDSVATFEGTIGY